MIWKAATTFEELTLLQNLVNSVDWIYQRKDVMLWKRKTTLYYDVASGLKVAESKVMEQGGKAWPKLQTTETTEK
jgi:hypothetical protein